MAIETQTARAALQELIPHLRCVSARARKLLAEIADHTYDGQMARRSPDTAYLPELYDSCGVGVEEMYPLLKELHESKLVELEGDYPFEDVRLPTGARGTVPLAELAHYCQASKVSLRDAVVNMNAELLK